MWNRFGTTGHAHKWFSSYFQGRKQTILIDGVKSKVQVLTYNVPQGSVLGLKFFTEYESPLGDITRSHGLQAHFYADDTQIYLVFHPNDEAAALGKINDWVTDIHSWLAIHFLKLNDEKSELIFLGSHQNLSKLIVNSIHIADSVIEKSNSVRNIGAMFDPQLKMEVQCSSTCKSAWFQIHTRLAKSDSIFPCNKPSQLPMPTLHLQWLIKK